MLLIEILFAVLVGGETACGRPWTVATVAKNDENEHVRPLSRDKCGDLFGKIA